MVITIRPGKDNYFVDIYDANLTFKESIECVNKLDAIQLAGRFRKRFKINGMLGLSPRFKSYCDNFNVKKNEKNYKEYINFDRWKRK